MRLAEPGRTEIRAISHNQQHRQIANAVDDDVEKLARGRVNPVRVFKNHHYRLECGEPNELGNEALQQ